MSARNTSTQYGWVTKSLHWIIAIGLWAMFFFGRYISNLELGPDNFHLIPRHKAFGIVILALITIRTLWRTTNPPPTALPAKPLEHFLAKTIHAMLYILMLAVPLFGWIGASATGFSIPFFDLFDVPLIWGEDDKVADLFLMLHGYAAMAMMALAALHILAALHHHFIKRDETLRRMIR
jgi:cytochrome b561